MIPVEWLQVNAPGFDSISPEERKAIMYFLFLWSRFESEALDRRGDVNALVTVALWWADDGLRSQGYRVTGTPRGVAYKP